MRFVDSNIFIYALLKPRRVLTYEEKKIKNKSKEIVERINKGEEVLTTVVHLSEIANILEDTINQSFSVEFLLNLLSKSNIHVSSVSKEQYISATIISEEHNISLNDALAYLIMKNRKVSEIYTFDRHFDNLPIKRLVD